MTQFKKYRLLLLLLLAAILLLTALLLSHSSVRCTMDNKTYKAYRESPIGAVMAELDYADAEKAVFHYLGGLFVYDLQEQQLLYRIDLSELNCAPHQNGSSSLLVTVSRDGTQALLSSEGPQEEVKNFDNYLLDLESGKVKKTSAQELSDPFTQYRGTLEVLSQVDGWCSGRCVTQDGTAYYLVVSGDMVIGSVRLAAVDLSSGQTREYSPLADKEK